VYCRDTITSESWWFEAEDVEPVNWIKTVQYKTGDIVDAWDEDYFDQRNHVLRSVIYLFSKGDSHFVCERDTYDGLSYKGMLSGIALTARTHIEKSIAHYTTTEAEQKLTELLGKKVKIV
jgi:hypothetical protein